MPLFLSRNQAKVVAARFAFTLGLIVIIGLFFWFALAVALSIPTSCIENNVIESKAILKEQGTGPKTNAALSLGDHYDNYTTYYMFNITLQHPENPFLGSLEANRYNSEDPDLNLEKSMTGESNSNYARYWHGYVIFLKPLLLVFNILQIRLICQVIFFLLLTCIVIKMTRISRSAGAFLLVFSFVGLGGAQASETLPLFFSFALSLVSALTLIRYMERKSVCKKREAFSESFNIFIIMLLTGALTVYFDFLDNPILTLCIPISIVIYSFQDRLSAKSIIFIVVCSIAGWVIGYCGLWIYKWILVSIFTNIDIFTDALDHASFHSGIEVGDVSESTKEIVSDSGIIAASSKNFHYLDFMGVVLIAVGLLSVVSPIYFFINSRISNKKSYLKTAYVCIVLILIGLIPYIWYGLLPNHSILHAGLFAYRTQIGALYAWALGSEMFLCTVFKNLRIKKSKDNARTIDLLS